MTEELTSTGFVPDNQRVDSVKFRCEGGIQGIVKKYPNGRVFLEMRCIDKRCADRNVGEVVFHYFDIETGKLDHTKKYRDPRKPKSMSGQDKSE